MIADTIRRACGQIEGVRSSSARAIACCTLAIACGSGSANDAGSSSGADDDPSATSPSSSGGEASSAGDPSTAGDVASEDESTRGTTDASPGTTTTPADTTGGDPYAGCFHEWTFDDCAADWEVGAADPSAPSPPGWACGAPPRPFALGGAHTSVWATALGGDYTEDQSSYLASPSFSLEDCAGASVYLSFAHLYQFGSGDGGTVQLSTDGGASWTTIEPSWHGYCPGTLEMPWSPPGGEPGFCDGDDEAWIHSLVPLDDVAGEPDVRVRFVFGSDGIIEQAGWYIDAVATEAY
jgi:hypothetical protein